MNALILTNKFIRVFVAFFFKKTVSNTPPAGDLGGFVIRNFLKYENIKIVSKSFRVLEKGHGVTGREESHIGSPISLHPASHSGVGQRNACCGGAARSGFVQWRDVEKQR
jgi:hypothetical protein